MLKLWRNTSLYFSSDWRRYSLPNIGNYIKIQIITFQIHETLSLTNLRNSSFTKSSSTYFMCLIFVNFPNYFVSIVFSFHILHASESVLPSWLRYPMQFRVSQSSTPCPQDPATIPYPEPVISNYSYIISIILLFHTKFYLFWRLSSIRLFWGVSTHTFCKHHASWWPPPPLHLILYNLVHLMIWVKWKILKIFQYVTKYGMVYSFLSLYFC